MASLFPLLERLIGWQRDAIVALMEIAYTAIGCNIMHLTPLWDGEVDSAFLASSSTIPVFKWPAGFQAYVKNVCKLVRAFCLYV